MLPLKLESLYSSFLIETAPVLDAFDVPLPLPNTHPVACHAIHKYSREMCVVRLHGAWSEFSRELILSSASEEPITSTGTVVPKAPGIVNRVDVLTYLKQYYKKPHYWEPNWHSAKQCIDAAKVLKISNFAQVSAALGSLSPEDDLRLIRNYLAHRNESTFKQLAPVLARFAVPSNVDAIALVTNVETSGVSRLTYWIEQLRLIAFAAIQ